MSVRSINKRLREEGFTLVELMIVVVIIGILAAVAIPQFQKFQLRSKHGEASTVLGGIHKAQESFAGKWNVYGEFNGVGGTLAAPDGDKGPWLQPGTTCDNLAAPKTGFCNVGYVPQGKTYFRYGTRIDTAAAGFNSGGAAVVLDPGGFVVTGEFVLGTDNEGYACGICNGTAVNGAIRATPGPDDIGITAYGDVDADTLYCNYWVTDERKDSKPSGAPGVNICGEDEY